MYEREGIQGTHLQTLRRSPLQQIIQSSDHDHAFQPAVYLYSTDDPPVLTLHVSKRRNAFLGAYEALAGVVRCVERGDVARAERRRGQREREGAEDAAEERGDGRDEAKLHARFRGRGSGEVGGSGEEFREVPSRLALMNMVRERVWTNTASEALGRHFGQRYRGSSGFTWSSDRPGTTVARDTKYGGPGGWSKVWKERRNEELCRGGIAAWV